MKGDDYMRGRHFWMHFVCGLIVGGIGGARISWGAFERFWACFGLGALIAIAFAFAVAYWGDPLWHWLLRNW